jgi:Protein of unknown function (DUF3990)
MARIRALPAIVVPPAWNPLNTHIILWHGSIRSAGLDIQANGIDLTRGRNNLDFGRSFYTTTNERQARNWAYIKFRNLQPVGQAADSPALLRFRIRLDILAPLECLIFVRGDATHDAFWSLVHHCRRSTAAAPRTHLHPSRAAPDNWYDVVCGPLAATWPPQGRVAFQDSDQFSFHTAAGIGILTDAIDAGQPEFQISVL